METEIHLLPCEVQHNGAANVEQYFHMTVSKEDLLEASFRGRKLYGRQVELPEGVQGEIKPQSEETHFSRIIYWKREAFSKEGNHLASAMDWPIVANKFMKPIDPTKVKDAMKKHS